MFQVQVRYCKRCLPIAIVALSMTVSSTAALAAGGEGTVAGNGQSIISHPAQILRMSTTLTAEAKNITDAIAKLKELQNSDRKKLTDLGATAESIEFGAAQLPSAVDPRQQYIQRMMAQQAARSGAKPAAKEPTVTVTCTLKAEWPIKSAPDSVLADNYALQQKVKAAQLAGGKDAKSVTPEEQEVLDEAQGMADQNGQAAASGEPAFVYVMHVSDEDRAAATADAFGKAKADAARLAKAAGTELAGLRKATSSSSIPGDGNDESQRYYMMMRGMNGAPSTAAPSSEATSLQAGPVTLQVDVTATFAVK